MDRLPRHAAHDGEKDLIIRVDCPSLGLLLSDISLFSLDQIPQKHSATQTVKKAGPAWAPLTYELALVFNQASPRLGLVMDRLPRHTAHDGEKDLIIRVACPSLGPTPHRLMK